MVRNAVAAALLSLIATPTLHAEGEKRDAAAVEAARKEMAAHGGARWEAARYFRFDFVVEFPGRKASFSHYWDRYTGRYRVDVPGEKGYTAYFDVNAPKDLGKAVILKNGARLTGDEAAKILASAYGRFINDSYWLLAPLKVLDPGVNLADEGEADFGGQKAHVIRLSFGDVGLTPGDVYKHFLDPATGRMLGWEYQLQGSEPPPTRWTWTDLKEVGGLLLSTRKVHPDGTKTIRFDNLAVSGTVDEAALKPPPTPAGAAAP